MVLMSERPQYFRPQDMLRAAAAGVLVHAAPVLAVEKNPPAERTAVLNEPYLPASERVADPRFMQTHGEAIPPKAFADFCERVQEACASLEMRNEEKMSRREGSTKDLEELQRINIEVNGSIEPESDMKHIGVDDQWDDIEYSDDKRGDCEEFAILKRKRLIALGWRSSDLLMTVVSTGEGEGHAVLTARTKRGDFILDNRHVEVLDWQATKNRAEDPYTFFMRQSYLNPKIWLSIVGNEKKEK